MAFPVTQSFETELDRINALFFLRDAARVEAFLHANRFLVPLLLDLHAVADQYFSNPDIWLEIFEDPESPEDVELIAVVTQTESSERAFEMMTHFDEDWWLDRLDQARGQLCILTGYK